MKTSENKDLTTVEMILKELNGESSSLLNYNDQETASVYDIIYKAEKSLDALENKNQSYESDDIGNLLAKSMKRMEEDNLLSGIPSGFSDLDRQTGGFQRGNLIIVAARPGMGSTSFCINIARNASISFKKHVAFFSLQASALQLTYKFLSSEAEVSYEKIIQENFSPEQVDDLNKKISNLKESSIHIDDTPALNFYELRKKCRILKDTKGLDLVIIDDLQLMDGNVRPDKDINIQIQLTSITRALKSLAKELEIAVIVISRLSRKVEKRGGMHRPILLDLRDNGPTEKYVDQVIFIYRPEYYNLTEDEEGNPTAGLAEIILAKNRNGVAISIPLRFIGRFSTFSDWEWKV